ncbi:MAG: hypothetical protein IJ039_05510 [Clostridia bacterium]|nr:hypothetical protein [Clostridia bacterium]
MARYKAIKPALENPKEIQAKKNAKRKFIILRVFSCIFVALLILGIIIAGTNFDNDFIFGWGYIIMGVISLLSIAFVMYTEAKEWYKNYIYIGKSAKCFQRVV